MFPNRGDWPNSPADFSLTFFSMTLTSAATVLFGASRFEVAAVQWFANL